MGREASLKDSIRELWPKVRALATKALDAYKENPELRQKVADQIQQGAEFGTSPPPSSPRANLDPMMMKMKTMAETIVDSTVV